GNIGFLVAALLKMLQDFIGFAQKLATLTQQFAAEVLGHGRVHKNFFIRRSVIRKQRHRHCLLASQNSHCFLRGI
ncbi:MAG TPA: hypothetical protein QGH84_09575, partial [Rhodospirillales bacterium]|nr:hypothetical protein [Rhodospirillales bacterium]